MDTYLKNITTFNQQLKREGLNPENLESLRSKKVDGIIVAGMGGSGLAGEVLAATKKDIGLKLPVFLHKDYGIPDAHKYGLESPFCVFTSFSGNTEETVFGLKEALSRKNRPVIAVIAAGGELLSIAKSKRLPLVSFDPQDLTPRQATGRMFYALIELLVSLKVIPSPISAMDRLDPAKFRTAGKALAKKLASGLVVIYTDEANKHLGYFWKIRINETAKQQAFLDVVPEMNHNEIVSFEKTSVKTTALFIHGGANPRLEKRIGIDKKLISKQHSRVIDVPLSGKNQLEQTWNMIMLADWTSYFMALLRGVDPAPVKIVEQLKDLMRK